MSCKYAYLPPSLISKCTCVTIWLNEREMQRKCSRLFVCFPEKSPMGEVGGGANAALCTIFLIGLIVVSSPLSTLVPLLPKDLASISAASSLSSICLLCTKYTHNSAAGVSNRLFSDGSVDKRHELAA